MQTYSAICVDQGTIRRVWFEAADADTARAFCLRKDLGLEGPATPVARMTPANEEPQPEPETYDAKTACRILGVSLATLYRWLDDGRLRRVGGTRRMLVTRQSIELLTRSAA